MAHLAEMTKPYSDLVREQDRLRAEHDAMRLQEEGRRRFGDDVAALKERFLELQMSQNPQQRGRDFEPLLADLLMLFDMEPRLAYVAGSEQIDGSLSFDTNDYVVEAKWLAEAVDRPTVDVFQTKVGFKGKNALGLFISVSGFTRAAGERYAERTAFIAVDAETCTPSWMVGSGSMTSCERSSGMPTRPGRASCL